MKIQKIPTITDPEKKIRENLQYQVKHGANYNQVLENKDK